MITTGDIEEILYKDLKKFGFKQYRKDAIKDGKVDSERLIVLCGTLEEDIFWSRAFVNINVCVPDFKGMANTKRLTEIERCYAISVPCQNMMKVLTGTRFVPQVKRRILI